MYHMSRADGPGRRSRKGANASEETEVRAYFTFPLSAKLARTTAKLSHLVIPQNILSDCSRRPVLEEAAARTPIANRAPNPPPPPPMPAQAPVAIPILPGGNEGPAPTPGPTPAPIRGVPRMTASGPITLPPGYVLPPGWAVIPAQNVQVVLPHQGPNTAGAQNVGGVANINIIGPQGNQGAPGPVPNSAGTPGVNGDVTGANPPIPNDHVGPPGATTTRPDATINIPTTSTAAPPNNSNSSTNTNTAAPNFMQRQAPRNWNQQGAHPSFPYTIPLFAMPGNTGIQYRATPFPPANGRTEGASTSNQSTPRVNGVGPTDERETAERLALLNQMNQSVRTMQDLVSRMSSLFPQANLVTTPTVEPAIQAPQSIPPTTTDQAESSASVTPSNGSTSDSSPPRTPPKTPTSLHLQRRRSFSPIERANENETSPDPIRRVSTSEDDFTPEELADIRAPWVEQDIEDGLPLQEILSSSKQGSPPRIRSPSRSPGRTLRRRGSLLKHDITNEMLQDRGRDKNRNMAGFEGATAVEGSTVDKGKGKEVFVEDVSDDE
jgi:hypothetical protein